MFHILSSNHILAAKKCLIFIIINWTLECFSTIIIVFLRDFFFLLFIHFPFFSPYLRLVFPSTIWLQAIWWIMTINNRHFRPQYNFSFTSLFFVHWKEETVNSIQLIRFCRSKVCYPYPVQQQTKIKEEKRTQSNPMHVPNCGRFVRHFVTPGSRAYPHFIYWTQMSVPFQRGHLYYLFVGAKYSYIV